MLHSIQDLMATFKAARQAKHYSQRELAKMLGIPQSHLSKIESGKVNITLTNFIEIARALDLEVKLIPIQHLQLINSILTSKSSGTQKARPAYAADDVEEEDNG